MELFSHEIARLVAAIIAGAIIGLERELADKPAGFRTNILICLGAAVFTLVSVRMAEGGGVDRTRIAAQIVSGVGFLGAGAIIQLRGAVVGLTTAATIWAVASLGMAFGAGEFVLGAVGTVLTAGILFGLGLVEGWINRWRVVSIFEVECDLETDVRGLIERTAREAGLRCRSCSLSKAPTSVSGRVTVVGSALQLKQFESALWREPVVRALRRM